MVTFAVDFFRHCNTGKRARGYAYLASLAAFHVNQDVTFDFSHNEKN
jgi:hypothetical protein